MTDISQFSDDDRRHMEHARRLGRRGLGNSGPNPSVGCVLVKDGRIVGVGWTGPTGRPHGEAAALAMAGAAARGATAYVTLEPCCHQGRAEPCAQALVAAGVARVVTAIGDPDPRVNGHGHALLRAAGLQVQTGLMAEEVREGLSGFLSTVLRKRPYVILKLAVSADVKIAAAPGRRTAITGLEANARVHIMRAEADAILVGIGTVLADDPELTCRLPGMADRSPVRVVADTQLAIPLGSKLVRTARDVPVWMLTSEHSDHVKAAALRDAGVEIIQCDLDDTGIDLGHALARLSARGINRVLAEGGARVARSLIEEGLADELALFTSPVQIGPDGVDVLAGLDLEDVLGSGRFTLAETAKFGADSMRVHHFRGGS